MSLPVVLALTIALLEQEEGCHRHAYPDPLSPMGKALGAAGINRCGSTGFVPRAHSHLSGKPWTIGYGATGEGIAQGVEWTQEQCRAALIDRAQQAQDHALRMWPGLALLHDKAQAALVSLVYNRGPSLADTDRRREMRELGPAIKARDYTAIARLIRGMKRLWTDAPGLLKRREREAVLVERMP